MPYTLIDHTADIGMRVNGATLEALFRDAALGLCDILGAGTTRAALSVPVRSQGVDRDDLLVRWLQDILFLVEVKGFRVAAVEVAGVAESEADGILRGEYSAAPLQAEVKAVTYHGLAVERIDNGFAATIILDT
jgi:SHS2 domain-containing protein